MAKIEFPKLLKQLLEESNLQAPLRALADQIGIILSDNKLPFFPDYTDHGIEHVNRVLQFEIDELVPSDVWSRPRLLCDADAAVIIGATLLHDIAMHMREDGFRELVRSDSRFKPLRWFKNAQEGHAADRPWHELWEEYTLEAKRFSERELAKIIGEKEAGIWKFHQLPDEIDQWVGNHYLIIGEFIRRHHARIAHEIAIYGFPGLPVGSGEHQFPEMGTEKGHHLGRLADLIGLTARSHGMNLRTCKSYLDWKYNGTPRPMGTAVLYPMALLRVADYFQIDRQRAPALLLQLRNPQSPVSVQEWEKHLAVLDICPATDPRGKMVMVREDICLSLYLQLQELLKKMQVELDHSTAVLDEAYGTRNDLGLDQLNLSIRRVYSNLHDTVFRDNLPYVPEQTGFRVDPNLLTLLVEPLYGKHPGVGVRELMQNAVDAVCELEVWSKAHDVDIKLLDLPEQDGDVLIEFIEREDSTWVLRVCDRGIGMTSDTIKNYFLRAGASFRNSEEWMKEFVGDDGKPRLARAGRFGIGAFAVFLLGDSFRLWTRHSGADKSEGYMIAALADSQLIEIQRNPNLPVGTTVEVDMNDETVNVFLLANEIELYKIFDREIADESDWFCWSWPNVVRRVVFMDNTKLLKQKYVLPDFRDNLPSEWSEIHPPGFDAVYWTFENAPSLSCNGLRIAEPISEPYIMFSDGMLEWSQETQLRIPSIAVRDSEANLPLTIQRYALSQRTVSFIDALARDITLSFIAYALVCGPTSCVEAMSLLVRRHPLVMEPIIKQSNHNDYYPVFAMSFLKWCATSNEMVPADAYLYSLLKKESCLVFGALFFHPRVIHPFTSQHVSESVIGQMSETGCTMLHWSCAIQADDDNDREKVIGWGAELFEDFTCEGLAVLGHELQASRVLVSAGNGFELDSTSSDEDCAVWRTIGGTASWPWFESGKGVLEPSISLETVLKELESKNESNPDIICAYVAEIKTQRVERQPESLIAKIWKECLGARAIPFNPDAREALITDGCKHSELKRHIEAWQEMKRTGSKWV